MREAEGPASGGFCESGVVWTVTLPLLVCEGEPGKLGPKRIMEVLLLPLLAVPECVNSSLWMSGWPEITRGPTQGTLPSLTPA